MKYSFPIWLSGTLAFFKKELIAIVRQPKLVLTLVAGPFAILALFGAGYKQTVDPLAAVFVIVDSGPFIDELESRTDELGDAFNFVGTVDTAGAALTEIRSGRADVAIVVPPNPVTKVRNGERAVFTILHDRLDPFEQATISLLARSTVNEINDRILQDLVTTGQSESADLAELVDETQTSLTAMRVAMETGNTEEAARKRNEVTSSLTAIRAETSLSEAVATSVGDGIGGGSDAASGTLGERLDRLSEGLDSVDLSESESLDEDIATVSALEQDAAELDEVLTEFRRIPPEVIVRPLGADTEVVSAADLQVVDFYAPGVIALLIQHLGIVFGGLSLVRERARGTTEVFQVAPVRPMQILLGKYAAYLVAAAVVAGSLSLLMTQVFGVPIVGSIWLFVAIMTLLNMASLGIGFVLSSVVDTDMQAVNAALIMLLLSIFFSGFFLSLDRLTNAVRVVSWSLPITHAIDSLRDVMFRGAGVDVRTWIALGGGSVVLFALAWMLLARKLASR